MLLLTGGPLWPRDAGGLVWGQDGIWAIWFDFLFCPLEVSSCVRFLPGRVLCLLTGVKTPVPGMFRLALARRDSPRPSTQPAGPLMTSSFLCCRSPDIGGCSGGDPGKLAWDRVSTYE